MFSHQYESQKTRQDEIFVSIGRMHILKFWADGVFKWWWYFPMKIRVSVSFSMNQKLSTHEQLNNPVVF